MKNMTLQNIAACLECPLHNGEGREAFEITGADLDSRKIEPGYLFFATRGERVDGHSFIGQAAAKGAALVVCEKAPDVDIPYILVEDSFRALKQVAAYYRQQLTIPVVGVTGSVGKTSTKEMIAAALSGKFRVLKTAGNYNNEVGVPLTILRIRDEHEAAVIEMGINHFGEMERLTAIVRPDIAVITNIGQCHLENLGDRDGVLKAKTAIFQGLPENGRAVLNGDDDKLVTVQEVRGRRPVYFGRNKAVARDCIAGTALNESPDSRTQTDPPDVYLEKILDTDLFGSRFVMNIFGESVEAFVPLPGEHMVTNALAAAAVGHLLGLTQTEIVNGIASVRAVDGRSHIIRKGDMTVIDDCYNANPVSMKSAIDLLMSAKGLKTAILGDMFELGEEELALHKDVGVYAARAGVDRLICIGELSRAMQEGAVSLKNTNAFYFPDKESFFKAFSPADFERDTVLIKASHGMAFQEIVNWLTE
ncbi:MAG: UDP-N-acetylmuramoyl-tripeptide--D-alanyl-D-alanine ligase [Lachnospiraceae bacterium]|nr:UDP-N-acetylmuramoyl-tripeptide--D-alanyl-D-alanine ligase [Lachnospiraceae bacterium]